MRQRGSYRQRGKRSWRLKFSRIDPLTGENLICYETVKGDEQAAKTRLAEIVAAIGNDTYTAPSKITVAEFLPPRVDQWEASGRISAKTAQRYRELVAGQIARHLGKKALQRLRPLDIEHSI